MRVRTARIVALGQVGISLARGVHDGLRVPAPGSACKVVGKGEEMQVNGRNLLRSLRKADKGGLTRKAERPFAAD